MDTTEYPHHVVMLRGEEDHENCLYNTCKYGTTGFSPDLLIPNMDMPSPLNLYGSQVSEPAPNGKTTVKPGLQLAYFQ